jgi:hypothetical protein
LVSFKPLPFHPRERATGTHFIGGWVDPRADLDDMEKWKYFTLPGLELPPPLVVQPVASRYTDWAIIGTSDKATSNICPAWVEPYDTNVLNDTSVMTDLNTLMEYTTTS